MATKVLRKEPALPPATLYLDDICEVIELITSLYRTQGEPSDLNFTYRVNDEFECTSISELEEHGGVAQEFEMLAETNGSRTPILSTTFRFKFRLPREIAESPAAREVSRQFERIVLDRKRSFQIFLLDIVDSGVLPPLIVVCMLVIVTLAVLTKNEELQLAGRIAVLVLPASYLPFLWASSSNKCSINLFYKRAIEKERIAKRKEIVEKIVLLVVGALLGLIGTLLVQHTKH